MSPVSARPPAGPSPFALVNYHLKAAGLDKELPKSGRVALAPEDAEKIQTQLAKLTPTDRASALQAFEQYNDRFEWSGAKKLLDVIGGPAKPVGDPPTVAAPKRSVRTAQADSLADKKPVSGKEMKATISAVDSAPAPEDIKDRVRAGIKEASSGAFKADTEARPAMVKGLAQADQDGSVTKAAEAMNARRASGMSALMAKATCFEDLLCLFMFEMAKDMQNEIKEKMDLIKGGDPNMPKIDRMKALIGVMKSLPPEAQANVAQRLQERMAQGPIPLKDTPEMAPLKAWVGDASKGAAPKETPTGAKGAAAAYEAPKAELPAIESPIARAMLKSDDAELMGLGHITEAMVLAKDLDQYTHLGPEGMANLDESKIADVKDKMERLEGHLHELGDALPEDAKRALLRPPANDMVSRQTQFEELKMLMNEFSQVMQALSNVLSSLDNLAMQAIRKTEVR